MNNVPLKRKSVIMIIGIDLVAFGIGVPLLVAGVLEKSSDAQGMAAAGATLCILGLLVHQWRPLLRQVGALDPTDGNKGRSNVDYKGVALAIGFVLFLGVLGRVNAQTESHTNWLYRIGDRLHDVERQVSNLEYERYR